MKYISNMIEGPKSTSGMTKSANGGLAGFSSTDDS